MPLSFTLQEITALFCWFVVVVSGQHQGHPVTSSPPVRIMQPSGREVQLECWTKNRQGSSSQECCKSHDVIWHYKRCQFGYNITPCHTYDDDSWIAICGSNAKPCQPTLVLNITTEANSGLYRCSVSHRNKTSKNFKVTQTYELEIIEMKGALPEFLQEQPSNVTVHVGEPAVFQCRIYSKVPPLFYWFRRQDESDANAVQITYLNDTFVPMNSSGELDLSNDVYLSKLILTRSTEQDNGYYICVAINDQGFQYRGAYLTVLKNIPLGQSTLETAPTSSLHALFLIPVALLIVPIVGWVYWKQQCRRSGLSSHSQQQPKITNESVHHNNNPVNKHQRSVFKYKPVNSVRHCSSNECHRKCSQFV